MEGKCVSVSSSGVEWEDLALYCGKGIEIQQQICFSMSSSSGSNALCGNDVVPISNYPKPISASDESTYDELFSIQRLGMTTSSSVEPAINLRLGRPKESIFPVSPLPMKRSRTCYHNLHNPYCQVEGCNLDLKSAKDYHRRHRICENHSKSPKVIVAGMERRFCQQCSRFHELSEFDDKKRSCRRRLSDHNARRRRVQPESLQLPSPRLPSAFYDQRIHPSLLLNGFPITQTGAFEGTLCFSNDEIRNSFSSLHLDQTKGFHCYNQTQIGPDLPTAHSLLSSNSWSLNDTETSRIQVHGNYVREMHSDSHHPLSLFHQNPSSLSITPHFSLVHNVNSPSEFQLFNSGTFYPNQRSL